MKYGIIGWGRACGWMLLGLSQSILWISGQPAGAEQADKLQAEQSAAQPSSQSVAREGCNRLLLLQQQLLDSIFVWQRADGGFSWQLQAQEGHRDTSAEGMIGYGAWLAAETAAVQRSEQWSPALSRLAATMQTSIQKGYVTDCSGECKGFAEYPQVYGTYPWGSGSALAFLAVQLSEKRITIGQNDPYALSQDKFDQTVWQEYQENRTENMGRVRYATRNIIFGFLGSGATTLLNFILRQVFITHLGDTLLGVQDLYSEILTMLSLAELGVGTALNYSLYGPVARGEREKIKSYMQLYKKAYRTIAIVIAVIGLALVPFLSWIVKNADYLTLRQLRVYYLLFLFNTVTTYFVAYKYSLANAEQKNYIQTNADAISKAVSVVLQLLGLLVLPNYLLYLLIQVGVSLGQKIFISCYLNRKYPLLLEKNVEPLTKEETGAVVDKTKALMLHRIGDMARLQTDAIIISSCLGVVWVGLIGTYKMIVNSVSGYVNLISTPSFPALEI